MKRIIPGLRGREPKEISLKNLANIIKLGGGDNRISSHELKIQDTNENL